MKHSKTLLAVALAAICTIACKKESVSPDADHPSTKANTEGLNPGFTNVLAETVNGEKSYYAWFNGTKLRVVGVALPTSPFFEGEAGGGEVAGPEHVIPLGGTAFCMAQWTTGTLPNGMSYDIEAYNNAVSEWTEKKLDDDTSNDGTPYPRMSDYFDATYGPWFEVIYYGQFVRTQSSPTTVAIAPGTYTPRVPLPVTW